jgi:pimeloyl-ACP methyl ester carboxylesterase
LERAAAIAREQDPDDLMRAIRVFHSRPDAMDVVASFDKPLMIVSGEADRFVPPAKSHATVANSRQGTARIVPSCGHYVNLERPAEFARILSEVAAAVGFDL